MSEVATSTGSPSRSRNRLIVSQRCASGWPPCTPMAAWPQSSRAATSSSTASALLQKTRAFKPPASCAAAWRSACWRCATLASLWTTSMCCTTERHDAKPVVPTWSTMVFGRQCSRESCAALSGHVAEKSSSCRACGVRATMSPSAAAPGSASVTTSASSTATMATRSSPRGVEPESPPDGASVALPLPSLKARTKRWGVASSTAVSRLRSSQMPGAPAPPWTQSLASIPTLSPPA
mmetsp:Transcript_55790/g.165910  ORF Transcript_55790/g.165910 Transcript_55790/m.165910 type:complete len:236 (+) Transcript_55790:857-1564(+)